MEELREKEEKSKAHKKEQQKEKRRAREDLTFEEDDGTCDELLWLWFHQRSY